MGWACFEKLLVCIHNIRELDRHNYLYGYIGPTHVAAGAVELNAYIMYGGCRYMYIINITILVSSFKFNNNPARYCIVYVYIYSALANWQANARMLTIFSVHNIMYNIIRIILIYFRGPIEQKERPVCGVCICQGFASAKSCWLVWNINIYFFVFVNTVY